jgi:Na+/H+ antiporter 1
LTRAELDEDSSWFDVLGLALLGGLGFTVSLWIGELAFGAGSERDNHVKLAVLIGSLLAATLATVVLRIRNEVYRRIEEAEAADDDTDGVPRHLPISVIRTWPPRRRSSPSPPMARSFEKGSGQPFTLLAKPSSTSTAAPAAIMALSRSRHEDQQL